MAIRVFARLWSALACAALLVGAWLMYPRHASAAGETPPPAALQPAGRWLSLVQRIERSPARQRPQGNFSLHFDLDRMQVAGHVPAPLPVAITLTREGVSLLQAVVSPYPDAGGYLYVAQLSPLWSNEFPRPGDLLQARQGGTVLRLTIPTIEAHLLASDDALTGLAPSGASLTAYLFPSDDPAAWYTATTLAQTSGAYTITWGAYPDVRPGDSGYVRYALDASRSVYRSFAALFLRVQNGGYQVDGRATIRTSLLLSTASGCEISAFADEAGQFSSHPGRYAEFPPAVLCRPLQAGDVVSAITDSGPVTTTVQTLTANVDGDTLFGQAPPGAQVTILHFAPPLQKRQRTWDNTPLQRVTAVADSAGAYSLTLPLENGDYGYVLLDNPDGHQTFAWFAAPYVRLHLGWSWDAFHAVSGQVDASLPLTVSVRGPSGYLKTSFVVDCQDDGVFPANGQEGYPFPANDTQAVALESGDRVTVTQFARGVIAVVDIPTLTLQVDTVAGVLYGQAPAGERIILEKISWEPQVSQVVVTASLTGAYSLPLTAFPSYAYQVYAFVIRWESPQGFSVDRAASPSTLLGGAVSVGGNQVMWFGNAFQQAPSIEVHLLSPTDTRKASLTVASNAFAAWFYDQERRPVPVLGGDTIEFVAGEKTIRWQVPPLDAHLDAARRQVSGSGYPDAPLLVQVYNAQTSWSTVVTPTASGVFSLSLPFTPTAGTSLKVQYAVGMVNFWAVDVLPAWEVHLHSRQAIGLLPPLSPYTLTLPQGAQAGYADSSGEWGADIGAELASGDVLTLTTPSALFEVSIPTLSALLNPRTATVQGQGPPDAVLRAALTWETYYKYLGVQTQEVRTDAEGRYQADFPQLRGRNIRSGELSYQPEEATTVVLGFSPAHWEVALGGSRVSGIAPYPGSAMQFRWQSAGGAVFTTSLTSLSLDGRFYVYLPQALQPGDRLWLTSTGGTVLSYSVPYLRVAHDYGRQVLTGEVPPGSVVESVFWKAYSGQSVVRPVWPDAAGRFGVDTSDLDLQVGASGLLRVIDGQGNRVEQNFRITGYRTWLPLIAR